LGRAVGNAAGPKQTKFLRRFFQKAAAFPLLQNLSKNPFLA
jgi:hypothetical protein